MSQFLSARATILDQFLLKPRRGSLPTQSVFFCTSGSIAHLLLWAQTFMKLFYLVHVRLSLFNCYLYYFEWVPPPPRLLFSFEAWSHSGWPGLHYVAQMDLELVMTLLLLQSPKCWHRHALPGGLMASIFYM